MKKEDLEKLGKETVRMTIREHPKFWVQKKVRLTKDERYLLVRLLEKEIVNAVEHMNPFFDDHIEDKRKEVMRCFDILCKISQNAKVHHKSMIGDKFTKEEQERYNVDEDGYSICPEIEELEELDD